MADLSGGDELVLVHVDKGEGLSDLFLAELLGPDDDDIGGGWIDE